MPQMSEKWINRFLDLATLVGSWSKDPSTQVGAVITRGNKIISLGYNGLPSGIEDTDDLLRDRERKLQSVLHAEVNAILHAKQDLSGCSLFCTHPPCSNCASLLIQAQFEAVYYPTPDPEFLIRWGHDINRMRAFLSEYGMEATEVGPLR